MFLNLNIDSFEAKQSLYLKCHFVFFFSFLLLFFDKLEYEIRKMEKSVYFCFVSILELSHKNIKLNGYSVFKITKYSNLNLKFVFGFSF